MLVPAPLHVDHDYMHVQHAVKPQWARDQENVFLSYATNHSAVIGMLSTAFALMALMSLSFAQILSEFGGWCRQSPPACEQTARCRGYCQQKAVMAAESMVVTGQHVAGHSALPSTQPGTLPIYSSVSAINTTCSGRGAIELTSNLRER